MSNSNFTLQIATVNGSGSQSANTILLKCLFRSGALVGAQNLFPSNIAGLPTWFSIRVDTNGFTSRRLPFDVLVTLNEATLRDDLKNLSPNGFVFYNAEWKVPFESLDSGPTFIPIPFRELSADLSETVKLRKLLQNLIYVGVLAELVGVDAKLAAGVIADQFGANQNVVIGNVNAYQKGAQFAQTLLARKEFCAKWKYRIATDPRLNEKRLLVDGNTSAALGSIMGGATVAAWYPITPASSLTESFENYAQKTRLQPDGKSSYAVIQAEDELAAICAVIGAGWAGARAFTATSGPGLSLMSEAAGLAYFAEVPAVIWDVQRVGPSTGLPTRTMQGDVMKAYHLSHGDTRHLVLIPGTPSECYEFAQLALDLAEKFQTLVIVLSDLDLGMNLRISEEFEYPEKPMNRGSVLSAQDLDKLSSFARYRDDNGEGIAARTLPGTNHKLAAYFTRGTGHDETSRYSEDPVIFRHLLDRLKLKHETARRDIPEPLMQIEPGSQASLITYGSSESGLSEVRSLLAEKGVITSSLRIRGLPMHSAVGDFVARSTGPLYVLEQNRDGQMTDILRAEFPEQASRFVLIRQYDGMTFEPALHAQQIVAHCKQGES